MPETTGCCDSRSKTKNTKDETGIDPAISKQGNLLPFKRAVGIILAVVAGGLLSYYA